MGEQPTDMGADLRGTGFGHWVSIIGPGLLMAGAAIGVSHLVQATRAGADFGFQLLLVVVAANLCKYPFFLYGHRYTVGCGESLLDGYLRMGRPWLWAFLAVNLPAAFISIAGVTFVTAALAENLFRTGWSFERWTVLLLTAAVAVAVVGRYRLLDRLIKFKMVVLFVATAVCFGAALWHGPVAATDYVGPSPWTFAALPFLIALMGWMPAPIELSVWQSLWIRARERTMHERTSMREAMIDFNTGYGLTVVTALMFLTLGATVMFGSGTTFAESGAGFAAQVVELYTRFLGDWFRPVIATAALMAMLSTTFTVVDAYPRSLQVGLALAVPQLRVGETVQRTVWMVICCGLALLIVLAFRGSLRGLVDFAASLAFLCAPFFAWLNFRLIRAPWVAPHVRPSRWLMAASYGGLLFLGGVSVVYLVYRVMA
jgi:Mn2+/Fe2+ NRAMP family transporter